MWGSGVQAEGCGDMGAYSKPLRVVCQDVQNPGADGVGETKALKFSNQSMRGNSIKSRAQVHKQQPQIGHRSLVCGW